MTRLAIFTILWLFFLQLLTEFVAAVYAFGLLGTSIPPEIVSVLLLLAPLLWLAWPRGVGHWGRLSLLLLFLAARVALPLVDTRGRMLLAGAGVALFLLWLPAWLVWVRVGRERQAALELGGGLILASLASALLRGLGNGVDLTTAGGGPLLVWLLAAVALVLVLWEAGRAEGETGAVSPPGAVRTRELLLPVLGLMGVVITVSFALGTPQVMARWISYSPRWTMGLLAVATLAWALVLVAPPLRRLLRPGLLWPLSLLFVALLALALWQEQPPFPASPDGYPFWPAPPPLPHLPLALALLLAPVLYLDFVLLARRLMERQVPLRPLSLAFAAGGLFLLLLIFAQVFTTVYDYIPLVGPWFRDRFWLVVPLPALVTALAIWASGRGAAAAADDEAEPVGKSTRASAGAPLLLAVVLGVGALLAAGSDVVGESDPAPAALRILTYNVQQGYDAAGERAYAEQLELLRASEADVIALQESDTARIAGGNDDLVRYFAEGLGYHSYYGPSPVVGTFGIALLSRYPLHEPRTFYLYSEGEQTATSMASLATDAGDCQVYVTHLGNGGPLVQQEAILQAVAGGEPLLLMGDFNFRPDTEQYARTVAQLADAWAAHGGQASATGSEHEKRIDHLFVSAGVTVEDARYLQSEASDHPPLMADVVCPAAGAE